jgi:PAS domain S-box-containing protein
MTDKSPKAAAFLLVAIALAGIVVGLGATTAQRRVESFQPLGFQAMLDGGQWLVLEVSDPSTGLEVGDQLLLVNGETYGQVNNLSEALRQRSESDLLLFRTGEAEPRTVTYTLPPLQIDYPYLILALIGLIYLAIGIYTLFRDHRRPAVVFFLWCLTTTAVYLISAVGPYDFLGRSAYFVEELARIFLAPLTLHFFAVFPSTLARSDRVEKAVPFFYIPAALLLAAQIDLVFLNGRFLFGGSAAGALAFLDTAELVHIILFALLAAAVLVWRLLNSEDLEQHRQTTWIAIGMVAGYLPFLGLYLLPELLGLPMPPLVTSLAVLPLSLVPLTFAYAILRYKLWDIGVIVRGTITASLTALIGVVGFSIANLTINRLVPDDMALGQNLLTFTSGLIIAGMLLPTRRALNGSFERFQYRGSWGRRRALADFGRELLTERNLEQLCKSLSQQLEISLGLRRTAFFVAHGTSLISVRAEGDVPDMVSFRQFESDFWQGDFEILHGVEMPSGEPTLLQRFYEAGYRYSFPLRVRESTLGFVLTGYRDDDLPFSSDDLDLVRNLLNQAALAIENAQLLHQLQQQLNEVLRLQEFTQGVVESSPAGIAVVDPEGEILSANLAFGGLVGSEPNRLRGRDLSEVLPVQPLPRPGAGLQEASFTGKEGEDHFVQLSAAELHQPDGEPHRVLVVQDVTERVTMENELKEKDRLASLGMLAAGVAHEVNTPITGISSYAQMLLADTPEEDPRHLLLKKMERQTFRAAQIVNNLLEFARNRQPDQATVQLEPLISESIDLLAERLAEHDIELEWQPSTGEAVVTGNAGELQQVFTNLVLNALEAMGTDGGKLTVELESDQRWVWVSVEDTGPGIAPNKLDKIFQPFFSSKLKTGGTGLGLAITYNIVRRHGGDIRVISHPGEGCRFVVELPVQPPA